MSALLKFEHVYAEYDHMKVLKDFSFEVEEGTIMGIIGPNGCGKTTLFDTLTGLIIPRKGRIIFGGRDITSFPQDRRCRMGIGRTYQMPRSFENMTVFENVLVSAVRCADNSEKTGTMCAYEALEQTGLLGIAETKAGTLTAYDEKRLEIARALSTDPKLILLDEAAADLSDTEAEDIKQLISAIKAERNLTVICVECMIDRITRSADALMCMFGGQALLLGPSTFVMNPRGKRRFIFTPNGVRS